MSFHQVSFVDDLLLLRPTRLPPGLSLLIIFPLVYLFQGHSCRKLHFQLQKGQLHFSNARLQLLKVHHIARVSCKHAVFLVVSSL
jgi:hypothetical protein